MKYTDVYETIYCSFCISVLLVKYKTLCSYLHCLFVADQSLFRSLFSSFLIQFRSVRSFFPPPSFMVVDRQAKRTQQQQKTPHFIYLLNKQTYMLFAFFFIQNNVNQLTVDTRKGKRKRKRDQSIVQQLKIFLCSYQLTIVRR